MANSKLSGCLITPTRLASAFKWNERSSSIMSLQISRVRIAIALMKNSEKDIEKLNPIHYREANSEKSYKHSKEEIRKKLLDIAKAENVCGIVVGWPLEPSGHPGSRCGQALNLLDYFAETSQDGGYLINKRSRPVALLDERIFTHGQFDEEIDSVDEWGRSRVFGRKFPLPSVDEFGNLKEYSFKTSLRSDHPTSEDSTAASLILEHFKLKYNLIDSYILEDLMGNTSNERRTSEKYSTKEVKELEEIIESFEESETQLKALPL